MSDAVGYPELLRKAIEKSASSRRKLSFALAARTGNQQSSEYRSIGKYLAGGEVPSQERAVQLAVLLDEPALAAVPDAMGRRRDRLAELEAEVSSFRGEHEAALQAVVVRLAELEAALANLEQRSAPGRSAGGRRR